MQEEGKSCNGRDNIAIRLNSMSINGRRQENDKSLDRYFRFNDPLTDRGELFKIIKDYITEQKSGVY